MSFRYPHVWQSTQDQHRCTICLTQWMSTRHALRHEETPKHIHTLRVLDRMPKPSLVPVDIELDVDLPSVQDEYGRPPLPTAYEDRPTAIHGPSLSSDPPDAIYDDWGGQLAMDYADHDARLDEESVPSWPSNEGLDKLAKETRSSGERTACEGRSRVGTGGGGSRERDTSFYSDVDDPVGFFPYPNRATCLMDVFGSSPRAHQSESHTESVRLFTELNSGKQLPSVRQLKYEREKIVKLAGANTRDHQSAHGNMFFTNDLETILKHEFSNPETRPHLRTYPEDRSRRGQSRSEAWHFSKWGEMAPANSACPMARASDGQDYYVYEPALVWVDGRLCPVMPTRFYMREKQMYVRACSMIRVMNEHGKLVYWVDGCSKSHELPLQDFRFSVIRFEELHETLNLPHPSKVEGVLLDTLQPPQAWGRPLHNPWRAKANGRRVLSVPIWLWCDDTSGNQSKKWNKHNSFLTTLTGLPRRMQQSSFNIHFLATSNIASPLEMLEAITSDLKTAQADGISAWDCCYQEDVLLAPWIFGLPGDNPMQSELCSHVGMSGNLFCRICKVSRARMDGTGANARTRSDAELLAEFLKIGPLRSKEDTLAELKSQLEKTLDGALTATASSGTNTGVKDKYSGQFMEQLQDASRQFKKSMHGDASADVLDQPDTLLGSEKDRLKLLLGDMRKSMPTGDKIFNSALSVNDLDPSQDTPVEVLHVVLLGFVKYFWRDVTSRLSADEKQLLIWRLDSLDLQALGLPRLRGESLVKYAGSLTGRDFRAIIQVAPSVLYGLQGLPAEAYEAWLSLSRLVPLVYQSEIDDLELDLAHLTNAIDDFLASTALWSTQWFNKSKFHTLLHLPDHVRRFGPAILYATEGFESYNAVIRLRSVHSSRQAPSKDIAESFSHLHAVRHLICGGAFFVPSVPKPCYAGAHFRSLLRDPRLAAVLGQGDLLNEDDVQANHVNIAKTTVPIPWSSSTSALTTSMPSSLRSSTPLVQGISASLPDGERITLNGMVVFCIDNLVRFGRVIEILASHTTRDVVGVLVQPYLRGPLTLPYRFYSAEEDKNACPIFLPLHNIRCPVHVFHNCARNECQPSQTREIRQERLKTGQMGHEVAHNINPDHLVFNHAQMGHARHIRPILGEVHYPGMSHDELIKHAIDNREQLEEEKRRKILEKAQAAEERRQKRERAAAAKQLKEAARAQKQAANRKNASGTASAVHTASNATIPEENDRPGGPARVEQGNARRVRHGGGRR